MKPCRVIKRTSLVLAVLLAMLSTGQASPPSSSVSEALISLNSSSPSDLDRMTRARDLLMRRHGFDRVQLVTDTAPGVLAARVRAFLNRPGKSGDRRLVWVSGLAEGHSDTICPEALVSAAQPRVMSIVMMPACLAQMIDMPGKTYAVARSQAAPENLAGMARMIGGGRGTALLTLPSHAAPAVRLADRAILDVIGGSRGVAIHPLGLLDALKLSQPKGGADYRSDLPDYRPGLKVRDWRGAFTKPRVKPAGRMP